MNYLIPYIKVSELVMPWIKIPGRVYIFCSRVFFKKVLKET